MTSFSVPIHHPDILHWTLVTIDMKEFKLHHYDSLGYDGTQEMERLLAYLRLEHLYKKKSEINVEFTIANMLEIPLQRNKYDCGVFVLQYSNHIARGCCNIHDNMIFTQNDIPLYRKRLIHQIMINKAIFP